MNIILIREVERIFKSKEKEFTRLQDCYSRLKKQAVKYNSYGMAGQMDSSGNVAYADNPFATNLNEFNRGVRQMLLMQRKWLIEQGSKSKGQQRSRVTETSRLPGDNMPEIDLSRRCFLKQDTR